MNSALATACMCDSVFHVKDESHFFALKFPKRAHRRRRPRRRWRQHIVIAPVFANETVLFTLFFTAKQAHKQTTIYTKLIAILTMLNVGCIFLSYSTNTHSFRFSIHFWRRTHDFPLKHYEIVQYDLGFYLFWNQYRRHNFSLVNMTFYYYCYCLSLARQNETTTTTTIESAVATNCVSRCILSAIALYFGVGRRANAQMRSSCAKLLCIYAFYVP